MGLKDLLRRWGRNDEERAERGEEGGLGLPDEPIAGDFVADSDRVEDVFPVDADSEPRP